MLLIFAYKKLNLLFFVYFNNIQINKMDQFVTDCPHKTPPMIIHVYDANGLCLYSYNAPAGFQLDRYVSSLHPLATSTIQFTQNKTNLTKKDFRVDIHENHVFIGTHLGIYL
jgi:hypothetical protein